jgi:TonB family protein
MSQRDERSTNPNFSGLTHWLIQKAAHRAPEALSSRLEEEWLADLESRSAAMSRLRFAVGCCWATLVIANDYPRNRAAAASRAAAPASAVVTLVERDFGYFSLRSATLFLIAGLHAVLFYGLIESLSRTHSPATPPNLENRHLASVPLEKVRVVVSPSELNPWTLYVPRPVVTLPPRLNIEDEVIPDVTGKPREVIIAPPVSPGGPARSVQRLGGGPGAGFPETSDFYPSPSIRWGEEGLATVQVCVDTRGRLTAEPTTIRGSGSVRLDEAAIKLARAGSGHYRPTTEDGLPVNSCYAFGVRFQLKK